MTFSYLPGPARRPPALHCVKIFTSQRRAGCGLVSWRAHQRRCHWAPGPGLCSCHTTQFPLDRKTTLLNKQENYCLIDNIRNVGNNLPKKQYLSIQHIPDSRIKVLRYSFSSKPPAHWTKRMQTKPVLVIWIFGDRIIKYLHIFVEYSHRHPLSAANVHIHIQSQYFIHLEHLREIRLGTEHWCWTWFAHNVSANTFL